MAKIIFIFIFIVSCASQKTDEDYGLSIKMRERLHVEQKYVADYKLQKDQLFKNYNPAKCLGNWSKNVGDLKQKLKKINKNKNRQRIWHELGNCYVLVGENKQALYYYDLVLGLKLNNQKINSGIYFNLGQIYENSNRDFMAYSFYKLANSLGDAGHYSLFKLGVLEFEQAEYSLSNNYFKKLQGYYPKSELVNFLIGVNYFHLGKKATYLNKVLRKIDEKSASGILLAMAIDFTEGRNLNTLEADLKNLELDFPIHKEFKSYLLNKLER